MKCSSFLQVCRVELEYPEELCYNYTDGGDVPDDAKEAIQVRE